MIERFLLPDWATAAQSFVYQMSRGPLYSIHDFGHGPGSLFLFINKRDQDHVDVVGHYHSYEQVVSDAIIVTAGVYDYFASYLWQLPTLERAEGHEMRFVVAL